MSMNRQTAPRDRHAYHSGMVAFFLSGICSISSGTIISLLRDRYQFSFSLSGTLVSAMSVGNMVALLVSGVLPGMIGERATTLTLTTGYLLGYLICALTGNPIFLAAAFLLAGIAKGSTANACTNLVGNNTDDRPRAMNLQNAYFAIGALLCPFLISSLLGVGASMPMFGVALVGLCLWFVFCFSGLSKRSASYAGKRAKTDYSFLKDRHFRLLALLALCGISSEYVVNGWVVTYYKNEQILSGALAAYTVTVQWVFALTARLLLAFLLKNRNPFKVLAIMGVGMAATYGVLVKVSAPLPALIALALFAFCVAGVYPLTLASIGDKLSPASVGILLSFAGIGGIVFPWLVGIVADAAGLRTGMAVNLIPCVGITVLSLLLLSHRKGQEHNTTKKERNAV